MKHHAMMVYWVSGGLDPHNIYRTSERSVLIHGSEAWEKKKKKAEKISLGSKIKSMRSTAGYTLLHHKQNEDILEELKIQSSNL
jgi:hypothetical protein